MQAMESLAEFNRNQTTTLAELKKTGEPLYLTRNGRAAAVIMSPEAFEQAVSFKSRVEENEMRTYEGLLRGYEDVRAGKVVTAQEADQRMRAEKGW